MCEKRQTVSSGFPTVRLRRLRHHPAVRRLVRETSLSPANLILPLFVRSGEHIRQEISAIPGHYQWWPDLLGKEIRHVAELRLGGVILFGIPDDKDAVGSDSMGNRGIIPQAVRVAKETAPELSVITDVCFCEYTEPGHCGPLSGVTRSHRRGQQRHAQDARPPGAGPRPGRSPI